MTLTIVVVEVVEDALEEGDEAVLGDELRRAVGGGSHDVDAAGAGPVARVCAACAAAAAAPAGVLGGEVVLRGGGLERGEDVLDLAGQDPDRRDTHLHSSPGVHSHAQRRTKRKRRRREREERITFSQTQKVKKKGTVKTSHRKRTPS